MSMLARHRRVLETMQNASVDHRHPAWSPGQREVWARYCSCRVRGGERGANRRHSEMRWKEGKAHEAVPLPIEIISPSSARGKGITSMWGSQSRTHRTRGIRGDPDWCFVGRDTCYTWVERYWHQRGKVQIKQWIPCDFLKSRRHSAHLKNFSP